MTDIKLYIVIAIEDSKHIIGAPDVQPDHQ